MEKPNIVVLTSITGGKDHLIEKQNKRGDKTCL